MSDFNVRSDSVDVEQVMEQIRARIREKRGVDYTEQQIRELAAVKLEKFLDPRGVRSDLLAEFRKSQPPPTPYTVPLYPFEDSTLFDSHRGIVRFIRRLLKPLLKLVFNANALSQSLHQQVEINRQAVERLDRLETSLRQTGDLYYELLHNLVLEFTRATIEIKNMKMRVESIASRLEFNERRARALESVVAYKPVEEPTRPERAVASERGGQQDRGGRPQGDNRFDRRSESRPPDVRRDVRPVVDRPPAPGIAAAEAAHESTPPGGVPAAAVAGEGPGQRSRRRRRRRGRRGGASAVATMGGGNTPGEPRVSAPANEQAAGGESHDEPAPHESASPPLDARDTRPEPVENAFGSSSHPAEQQTDAPNDTAAPPADRQAPGSPDSDQ
jgi:hypothetical protein